MTVSGGGRGNEGGEKIATNILRNVHMSNIDGCASDAIWLLGAARCSMRVSCGGKERRPRLRAAALTALEGKEAIYHCVSRVVNREFVLKRGGVP